MILKNFELQARNNPHKIALIAFNESISFGDLNLKSNVLADFFRRRNSEANEVIGIYDVGSINHFISMLACLKARQPFINFDMYAPELYNEKIISRLNVRTVIVNSSAKCQGFQNYHKTNVEELLQSYNPSTIVESCFPKSELAYFVATSGTTGEPKLVAKNLKTLAFSLKQIRQKLPFLFEGAVQMSVPLNYAFGLDQVLIFLCAGVTVCIDSHEDFFNLQQQYSYIERNKAQTVFWGSPVLKLLSRQPQLFDGVPSCLKSIVVGGEPLIVSAAFLFELRNREISLLNNYGCTETGTLFFSAVQIPLTQIQEYNRIPIGEPLQGFDVVLSGEESSKGQLVIYAKKFFNEYTGDSFSTSSRFNLVPNADGKVCFYTGDIAEKIDGKYYIVGRHDNCVNVRGYRVELEAIEQYISQLLDDDECCVVPQKNEYDEIYLACFYRKGVAESHKLFDSLKKLLPRYMIPTKFFAQTQLPKLPNGKINRKALENFFPKYAKTEIQAAKFLEQRIKKLLEDTLRSTVPENFKECTFDELGLDSLSLVDFICKVEFAEKIVIDDAVITDKKFKTLGDLIEIVRKKK